MCPKLKFAVIKETKKPHDKRVIFTPEIALEFTKKFPYADLVIQPCDLRCYKNEEYLKLGLKMQEDISDCDILMGIKEVSTGYLIPDKQYHFFSHTHKFQEYNRNLLKKMIELNITMVDHELLTYKNGTRVVAFGRWAGIVGAYNAMYVQGLKSKKFKLKRAKDCFDYNEVLREIKKVSIPDNFKIIITGKGRVGQGAMELLKPLKLKNLSPYEFLNQNFSEPVVCQIDVEDYVLHKDGINFNFNDFITNPNNYKSDFKKYSKHADMWIACHFWDPKSPVFLTDEDYNDSDFKTNLIADISCDIAAPIPSTIRASTIDHPIYGYCKKTGKETLPLEENSVTVMAVDNLPGELPRDSSFDFGHIFINNVIPNITNEDKEDIIKRATICKDEKLTGAFEYLTDFVRGK